MQSSTTVSEQAEDSKSLTAPCVQSSRGTTCETNEESYCPAIGSTCLRLHCFFFLFYKCEVLCQVRQLHFSYVLIPLQARMYKSRIEIIEKLLGVLELDSDKHG